MTLESGVQLSETFYTAGNSHECENTQPNLLLQDQYSTSPIWAFVAEITWCYRVVVKAKLSLYRPRLAPRAPGV
jgi:hypothetical protein